MIERAELGGGGVLQEHQVEDHALVVRQRLGVGIDGRFDGQIGDRVDGNDAVEVAHLHHGGAVDAQDGFHQLHEVHRLDLAIGIDDDGAFEARVEDVVDFEFPGERVDHLGEGNAAQLEGRIGAEVFRRGRRLLAGGLLIGGGRTGGGGLSGRRGLDRGLLVGCRLGSFRLGRLRRLEIDHSRRRLGGQRSRHGKSGRG